MKFPHTHSNCLYDDRLLLQVTLICGPTGGATMVYPVSTAGQLPSSLSVCVCNICVCNVCVCSGFRHLYVCYTSFRSNGCRVTSCVTVCTHLHTDTGWRGFSSKGNDSVASSTSVTLCCQVTEVTMAAHLTSRLTQNTAAQPLSLSLSLSLSASVLPARGSWRAGH